MRKSPAEVPLKNNHNLKVLKTQKLSEAEVFNNFFALLHNQRDSTQKEIQLLLIAPSGQYRQSKIT
jgi:hypothetical protein